MSGGPRARAERLGETLGERRAKQVRRALAERVEDQVPGIAARADAGGVRLRGRGLGRRLLRDPALRWIGGYWG